MRKLAYTLIVTATITFCFFFSALCQEEMELVDNSVFKKAKRPPSVFRHEEHNQRAGLDDCSECHHVYEEGKKIEGESSEDRRCSECHSEEASGRQPSLMKSFHLNCKGCHTSTGKGPVMCGECHRTNK